MNSKRTGKTSRTGTMTKSKRKSKGLGDTVAKATKAKGIDKAVKWLVGEDCGCDKRKDLLNKLFPYNTPECLLEDEFTFLTELEPFNRVEYKRAEVVKIVQINNRVFHQKLDPGTNCGRCVKDILDKLKTVYNQYKEDYAIQS